MLNFSTQYARGDAGPTMRDGTKGMFLHCALALTPEKKCLGVISNKQWHREGLQKLSRSERTRKDYVTPIEDKESYRWLENYRLANEYAAKLPNTTIVSIADREGDIYKLYEEANKIFAKGKSKAHYLIRAKCDRKVCTETGKLTADSIKLTLRNEKPLGAVTS